MPASSPTSSSRLWLLALPPLALIAGIAGLQLGALNAPTAHEAGYEPPVARSKTSSGSRPASSLAKPQFTPGAVTSSALSESPAAPPVRSAAPAKVTPPLAERVQQLFARERAPSPPPLESVDPYLPGHSISANGQRVFIESSQVLVESGQNALDVAIVPDPDSSSAGSGLNSPSSVDTPQAASAPRLSSRIGKGFTPEELAFRAKWGWAAHNAALRAAFEAADGAP